jgi:hypothetical protein
LLFVKGIIFKNISTFTINDEASLGKEFTRFHINWAQQCMVVIPVMPGRLIRGSEFRLAWAKHKTLSPKQLKHKRLEVWMKW